jgi:predicted NACHT family NTPase
MYERKMSEIVLHCLGRENTPFAIRIDENELVDFLKDKIKEKLQLEYPAIKIKLWRINIPYNEEIRTLDIQSIANKVEMIPIRKIKDYKDGLPFDTNDIHVFVEHPLSS